MKMQTAVTLESTCVLRRNEERVALATFLSEISRSLTQCNSKNWVALAGEMKSFAEALGYGGLADRCHQLEQIQNPGNRNVAEIIVENIEREVALLSQDQPTVDSCSAAVA